MVKEQIIGNIIFISKQLGLKVETKCKCDKWSADVVVTYGTYRVAFNVCKSPRNVAETYKAMRKERVCGCWLLMPSKNRTFFSKELPCFELTEKTDRLYAVIHSCFYDANKCDMMDFNIFVASLIKGNIRFVQNIKVKFVEICFFDFECWKCHKKNNVYFITRLISTDGVSVSPDDFQFEDMDAYPILEDLEFNPMIVSGVEQYIRNYPEKSLIMGRVKPRYIGTKQTSCLSFGCAFCDSPFGKNYINDDTNELIYFSDALQKALIEIHGDMIIPANRWHKRIESQ